MDTKAHAPGLSFTVAMYLFVMVLCESRSELAPQPALCFIVATYVASISSRTYLLRILFILDRIRILIHMLIFWSEDTSPIRIQEVGAKISSDSRNVGVEYIQVV